LEHSSTPHSSLRVHQRTRGSTPPAPLCSLLAPSFNRACQLSIHRRKSLPPLKSTAGDASGKSESARQIVSAGDTDTIPVFPLSLVALPAADVPLQIFEARYRVLFSTLLAGSEGIDDGLINPEKTWTGTRRFGLSFFDPQSQGLASVGTILEIKAHTLLDDGRILIDNLGRERYKILEVVEERPVLVCKIQYLDSTLEEEDKKKNGDNNNNNNSDEEEKELAVKAAQLFKSVVQLSIKLRDSPLPSEVADPSQLRELSPRDLSFWMASLIAGNPYQQQALLEEETTMDRLKAVVDLMESTLKYLSAQSALQSAFKSTGDEAASDAPGPD